MLRAFASLAALALGLTAASPRAAAAAPYPPHSSYGEFYAAFSNPSLDPARGARVEGLVLERGPARFRLDRGTLHLGLPVGGRTLTAVFVGKGRFEFRPPEGIERDEMERLLEADTIDEEIETVVLLFADSTLAELGRLSFSPMSVPGGARRALDECFRYFGDPKTDYLDPGLALPLLDGRDSPHFYAYLPVTRWGRLMFEIDPTLPDDVILWREAKRHRIGFTRRYPLELVCQLARAGDAPEPPLAVPRSAVACEVSKNLRFGAMADLDCEVRGEEAQWLALELFQELEVDSVTWDGRPVASWHRRPGSRQLWVRCAQPLERGARGVLRIAYHGALFENIGDWLFLRSANRWYPAATGADPARFEVTFRVPEAYAVASAGERTGQRTERGVTTSRWVADAPTGAISFVIGRFREVQLRPDSPSPIMALVFTGIPGRYVVEHEQLDRTVQQTVIEPPADERVLEDMAEAAELYSSALGAPRCRGLWMAGASKRGGESWPCLVNASWLSRADPEEAYESRYLRARLVAEQWWRYGTPPRSRRDQWLSEGLSGVAALWHLERGEDGAEVREEMLRRWRDEIVEERTDRARGRAPAGPIGLGNRSSSLERASEYDRILEIKGAWVAYMLRGMLADSATGNDRRFVALLKDVHTAHSEGTLSTEEFRRAAEARAGQDLGWFFHQWVYRTEVPRLRCAHLARLEADGTYRMTCRVDMSGVPDDFRLLLPVRVDLRDGRSVRTSLSVRGPRTEQELPPLPAEPRAIVFNVGEGVLAEVETTRW